MKKIKKGRKKGQTGEKEKLIRNRKFKRKLRIKIKKWSKIKKYHLVIYFINVQIEAKEGEKHIFYLSTLFVPI